jgi:unsaturated rhamnogalacturonyl hydrolase
MALAEIDSALPVSQRMALSVMNRYGPKQAQWHYEHGLVLQSIFLLGQKTGKEEFLRYVKEIYDSMISPDGEIRTYREGEYNLDQVNPGKTLFLLYARYGEEKYRKAIEKLMDQLRGQPRTKSGGFWHKKIYPWQMWLDGLYMEAPFYAQYTKEFGDGGAPNGATSFEDVARQFSLIESKARDPKTGLLYHAWDESLNQKWANPATGCSPHFWGRALGWYCMALADVLDFIPASSQQAETLRAIAGRLFAPLIKYQDADSGLWFQVLDRGSDPGNYTESSCSSMFTYFLFKMTRLEVAHNKDQLKAAAEKAYQGLVKHKLQEDPSGELHLTGICKVAGLGGEPYRDGSYEYYVNEPQAVDDFKGVGPFILASMENEQ